MGEIVVVEQRPGVVGDDELVGLLAVANRVGILFVVFDQADDFELQRLAVVGFDNEDIAQFQRAAVALAGTVASAVRTFDDDFSLLREVPFDVGVVLLERLRERVVSVTLVDVEHILRVDRGEGRIDRRFAGICDRRGR